MLQSFPLSAVCTSEQNSFPPLDNKRKFDYSSHEALTVCQRHRLMGYQKLNLTVNWAIY